MLLRWQIGAAGLALLFALHSPAAAEDKYCDLVSPPANAAVGEDHGTFSFVFPDALPDHFTGCKTLWIETGQKFLIFHVADGRVTELDFLESSDPSSTAQPEYSKCFYSDEKIAPNAPNDCPSYSDAQGWLAPEGGEAPPVPPAKDIRTKTPL